MLTEKIEKLKFLIDTARRIVFFGGAGVSTESGIPDFRSADGLYNQQHKYPPEYMLSYSFFKENADDFFSFYRTSIIPPDSVKPNMAHKYLAKLEERGKLIAIVTQNIDGLHQAAGSKNVLELHGSVWRNYCQKCKKFYCTLPKESNVPKCTCGGVIKPDVVLYEESLCSKILGEAVKHISQSDLLIVGGTSLQVYPAAGLIRYFRGETLVIINKSSTIHDENADLLITDSISKVFGAL